MLSNLVESGSHAGDFKRRGTFFLGTLGFYGLIFALAGVGSIYAYNVRLDDKNDLELVAMMRFAPAVSKNEPPLKREKPKPVASSNRASSFAQRPEISVQTPYERGKMAHESTREVSARTTLVISNMTSDPGTSGGPLGHVPTGGHNTRSTGDDGPVIAYEKAPPPPVFVKPTPAPQPLAEKVEKKASTVVSLGVINGKAVAKPAPPYPAIARAARVSGTVTVQILVDEEGRVASARVTNGHPLLHAVCVQAAHRAQFSPTLLSNRPVKVSGYITYNFVLQ